MVPVQTGSEMVLGNMGMPRLETKWSGVFGKIPDLDWDCGVWSGPDWVSIGLGPNFPNTRPQSPPANQWVSYEQVGMVVWTSRHHGTDE